MKKIIKFGDYMTPTSSPNHHGNQLQCFNPFITAKHIYWTIPQYCQFLFNEWYCLIPILQNLAVLGTWGVTLPMIMFYHIRY